MKAGRGSCELVVDHSDFVSPSYGWREPSSNCRAHAAHLRQSRLEKCSARRSELEIESARTAAELSSTHPLGIELRELSHGMRSLLRKLGAVAIELAALSREVATLSESCDRDQLAHRLESSGVQAR